MSDTLRVDEKFMELERLEDKRVSFASMTHLARTLERELNKANAIIAAALAYVEEFKEFFPEETLIAILEGKVQAVNKREDN